MIEVLDGVVGRVGGERAVGGGTGISLLEGRGESLLHISVQVAANGGGPVLLLTALLYFIMVFHVLFHLPSVGNVACRTPISRDFSEPTVVAVVEADICSVASELSGMDRRDIRTFALCSRLDSHIVLIPKSVICGFFKVALGCCWTFIGAAKQICNLGFHNGVATHTKVVAFMTGAPQKTLAVLTWIFTS